MAITSNQGLTPQQAIEQVQKLFEEPVALEVSSSSPLIPALANIVSGYAAGPLPDAVTGWKIIVDQMRPAPLLPPLPANLVSILNSKCPINYNSKKIIETHTLIPVIEHPSAWVDAVVRAAGIPQGNFLVVSTISTTVNLLQQHSIKSPTRWILATDIQKESLGKSEKAWQELVQDVKKRSYVNYRIPDPREEYVSFSNDWLKNRENSPNNKQVSSGVNISKQCTVNPPPLTVSCIGAIPGAGTCAPKGYIVGIRLVRDFIAPPAAHP
jgi:hypothetical protein